ncbi:MAG: MSHA biogenesis protein MshG [Curvibacter sp. RIFCSPHIGHO2_12_FULL_63_18]|uniref:type II secretion system F family protein n=1 Tax=Rhodoferax sp. TaxID=50421 RepID=UPI0008C5BAF1|nr:type II secretion system F family protein [Rhodoferax sp.]OGP00390.1 MAG: MSHA biogenesis protein MshG [Curvibacter sp. GWA2_63_95]OGP07124.1 MAG: MSHA biogenesis protein MshG [Curvibacter sp. RIFCSPHIGHO2_12_FULL_63_18]HCX82060.1 MSHA biogenesis protein MshG [Rhodoferax sp.]
MALYAWRGRNNRGEAVNGQLEALTEGGVADQLLSIGVSPVHIALAEAKEAKSTGSALAWLNRKPVVVEDLLIFSRQMYTLNKAGVPILRAFAGLEASATKPAMVDMLKDIRASLDQGRELSASLARHSALFGGFYISMIRVGEMTGRLTEVFLRLTEHMEFERDVRERIKQAMRYPMFVMIAMAIAIVILNIFVIPVFAKVFAGFNTQLPLITRGLLAFSSWMITWWPLLLALAAGAVVGVRAYLRTPEGRYRWDSRKLKLPIVGDIILKATLARFARSFALSSQSGVPLVQALTVVAQTVDNAFIGSRIEQMRDGIERGESISRCAAATGVFTPVVLQMINVGEETGELDNLLFEIAAMYERDTDYSIKGLSASIEPILLAVIGVLVLLLALGVFLPLWNMGQAAMGRGGG